MTPSKHDVPPHTPPEPSKQAQSDEIAKQVAEWQAINGEIPKVPTKTAKEIIQNNRITYAMRDTNNIKATK